MVNKILDSSWRGYLIHQWRDRLIHLRPKAAYYYVEVNMFIQYTYTRWCICYICGWKLGKLIQIFKKGVESRCNEAIMSKIDYYLTIIWQSLILSCRFWLTNNILTFISQYKNLNNCFPLAYDNIKSSSPLHIITLVI